MNRLSSSIKRSPSCANDAATLESTSNESITSTQRRSLKVMLCRAGQSPETSPIPEPAFTPWSIGVHHLLLAEAAALRESPSICRHGLLPTLACVQRSGPFSPCKWPPATILTAQAFALLYECHGLASRCDGFVICDKLHIYHRCMGLLFCVAASTVMMETTESCAVRRGPLYYSPLFHPGSHALMDGKQEPPEGPPGTAASAAAASLGQVCGWHALLVLDDAGPPLDASTACQAVCACACGQPNATQQERTTTKPSYNPNRLRLPPKTSRKPQVCCMQMLAAVPLALTTSWCVVLRSSDVLPSGTISTPGRIFATRTSAVW